MNKNSKKKRREKVYASRVLSVKLEEPNGRKEGMQDRYRQTCTHTVKQVKVCSDEYEHQSIFHPLDRQNERVSEKMTETREKLENAQRLESSITIETRPVLSSSQGRKRGRERKKGGAREDSERVIDYMSLLSR